MYTYSCIVRRFTHTHPLPRIHIHDAEIHTQSPLKSHSPPHPWWRPDCHAMQQVNYIEEAERCCRKKTSRAEMIDSDITHFFLPSKTVAAWQRRQTAAATFPLRIYTHDALLRHKVACRNAAYPCRGEKCHLSPSSHEGKRNLAYSFPFFLPKYVYWIVSLRALLGYKSYEAI